MNAKDDTTRLSLCDGAYTTSTTTTTTVTTSTTTTTTTTATTSTTTTTTTTTTSTTTIPNGYSLMRSGSCPSPFAFIESLQECSAAARALDLVDKTASRISTTVPNNRAEVPHGCYFFQRNPGNYKLFWNEEGRMDAADDEARLSVCIGNFATTTLTTTTTTATTTVDYPNPCGCDSYLLGAKP